MATVIATLTLKEKEAKTQHEKPETFFTLSKLNVLAPE